MTMYQKTSGGSIKRLSDGAIIPDDPTNRHRLEYLRWLDAGGVPLPWKTQEQLDAEAQEAYDKAQEAYDKAQEEAKEEVMREKYGLKAMKSASLDELEAETDKILGEVGGVNTALKMLAMAVALIDRRLERRGL